MGGNQLIEGPTLVDLTLAALRRVIAAHHASACTYQGWDPASALLANVSEDWRAWENCAIETPAGRWAGSRHDLSRWSGSQRKRQELWGVAGQLALPAGPGALAPLLIAAAWLHLGKGYVHGMGRPLITLLRR